MTHKGLSSTRVLLLDPNSSNYNEHAYSEDIENFGTSDTIILNSPVTLFLIFTTFIAVCGSFCYGSALGFSSPAQAAITEELHLSIASYSIFGSILTFGGIFGAISSGKVADGIGRKRAMLLSELFCTPGWLALTFAKNSWWLYIGRLLIGFGVGLLTYVVPVYVAEITPKNVRGRFTSASQLMTTFGFALLYFVGNLIPWRTLSFLAAIPCIVQIIGLFFIPESPRWLAKVGREKEIEAALQKLRGKNANVSEEATEIRETIETLQEKSTEVKSKLFQKKYAYPIFVGVGLMFLQQIGGTAGISFYATSIFEKAGFSTIIGTTAIAVIQILTSVLALLLMDIYGRTTLLMVSSIFSSLFLLLVGVSFYFQEHMFFTELTPSLVFIGLLGYYGAFIIGLTGIPWVIMSEIFPINIKATAGSLVTLTNWSSCWLVTFTFNFMVQWSIVGTFLFFGIVCGLTAVFTWKFVPETKGKTLEEIQAKITNHSILK